LLQIFYGNILAFCNGSQSNGPFVVVLGHVQDESGAVAAPVDSFILECLIMLLFSFAK
jgi:hypothetical protein